MLKKIEKLFFSDEFSVLDTHSSEFDLFKTMGIRHKKYVHSNILATLLDPNCFHGIGHLFINLFIRTLKELTVYSGTSLSLATIISATDAKVIVSRELAYIDIVVEFPKANLVIAIENKIWAGEQNNQIMRYQATLATRYTNYQKALIFLTPNGKNPTTADNKSPIPIYCMSYGNISRICKLVMHKAGRTANFFIEQFVSHLERYMTGNNEVKDLCWQLFQKHEEAYCFMAKYHAYCIARKVKECFDEISNRIRNDDLFSTWRSHLEIKKIYHEDKNKFDLNLRNKLWPKGIYIKIYKHYWLGVFPFVDESDTELVKKYFPHPRIVKDWGCYYFSANESLNNERRILENGNEITSTEINVILNRVKEFMQEIEELLRKEVI